MMNHKLRNVLRAAALTGVLIAMPALAANPMIEEDFWEGADLAKVQASVVAGNSATDISENGYTPLIRALRANAGMEIVDYLIAEGADINRAGHDERPALFWAARYTDVGMVQHLIDLGADITATDDNGTDALNYAASGQRDQGVFEVLIAAGLDPKAVNESGRNAALSAAQQNPNLDVVLYLAGLSDLSIKATDGSDAFMQAASRNQNVEVVKAMMEKSSDPHARTVDDNEDALLIAAERNGSLEVIDFLLSNGFDAATKNAEGRDALSIASYRNTQEIVQRFLGLGLDVNGADAHGKSPLIYAAERNVPEVVSMLIDAGAKIDARDVEGNSALLVAAGREIEGAAEIVTALIAAGAEANVTNQAAVTPLIAAARISHPTEMLQVFIEGGVDVNAADGEGATALMYAALKSPDIKNIELLLAAGANPAAQDGFGETAADMAGENQLLTGTRAVELLTAK